MTGTNFSWLAELLSALIVGGLLSHYIYFWAVKSKYWAKSNVPHLPPKYYGNLITLGINRSVTGFFQEIYREHKEKRLLGLWLLQSPMLTVFDRDIIKIIVTRDFSNFHDRFNFGYGEHDPLTAHNLLTVNGDAWRNMRVKLTPAFSAGKLKMMFPTLMKCGEELRDYLDKSAQTGATFDCKDISARYLVTCIGTCAFGIDTNAMKDPHSEFFYWGNQVFNLKWKEHIKFLTMLMFPSVGTFFKMSFLPKGAQEFFINAVAETIEYRKTNNITRKDFMQQLIEMIETDQMQANKPAPQDSRDKMVKMTVETAAAQAFIFFLAGYESTSTTMTHALYELALNQDIQNTLRNEIRTAAEKEGSCLSYDTIMQMEYLDCVLQETLRKYPVFPLYFRTAEKDYHIAEMDVTIPKGTMIAIPAYSLAHDPEYFPDPDKFDPVRFSKERKHEIHPYSHIPFGEGPRNCIGSRLALLQGKIGIVSILMNFSLLPTQQTPQELKYSIDRIALSISNDLHLRLVPDKIQECTT